jgi:hypothetical protein
MHAGTRVAICLRMTRVDDNPRLASPQPLCIGSKAVNSTPHTPASRADERRGATVAGRTNDALIHSRRSITCATVRSAVTIVGVPMIAILSAGSASAETLPLADALTVATACTAPVEDVRLLEWDLNQAGDSIVGALVVDDQSSSRNSKLWFVTRAESTRLYRFTPGKGMRKDQAEAKSWDLGAIQTGGVRVRHSSDGRNVFVNTNKENNLAGLVQVDTGDNTRVAWNDRPTQDHMSDVSVDTRGGHTVFTAALFYNNPMGGPDGFDGVVQRLRPGQPVYKNGKWVVPAEATRWLVGGGAGSCVDTGFGAPCIPGIAVDRRRGHPIYFSAPQFVKPGTTAAISAIGEIDPNPVKCNPSDSSTGCVKVRYWPLPATDANGLAVSGPRQILVDDAGKLWGITSSGHLFSLVVDRNYDQAVVTLHDPRGPLTEDLFAVSPDGGVVGFTDSENNEVSVLFPERKPRPVTPVPVLVTRVTRQIEGVRENAAPFVHMVDPRQATAFGDKYTNPGDGTYVETNVSIAAPDDPSSTNSLIPTGMAPDGARRSGSFFYGASFSNSATGPSNRVGHLSINVDPNRELENRKDDDDFDDDGIPDDMDDDDDDDGIPDDMDNDDDNDCILDHMDTDKDNDGIEDEYDSASHREHKRIDRGQMAPGERKEYEMTSDPNSVVMLAVVEAATLTTPLSIEIVDPNGVVVLTTPPALGKAVATVTPGLAGVFTVRVKNGGTTATTYKTTLIGRQIWF